MCANETVQGDQGITRAPPWHKFLPPLYGTRTSPYLDIFRLLLLSALLCGWTQGAAASDFFNPVGGETWAVGSQHVVRWKPAALGPGTNLVAHYSSDEGAHWKAIPSVYLHPSRAELHWTIPGPPQENVRLRITNATSGVSISTPTPFPFAITPSQAVSNYQWTQVTAEVTYAPRDGAGALTFQDRMFLLGGWHPGNKNDFPMICNNEVWSSQNGAAWTLVKPNSHLGPQFDRSADWEGRHTAGYVIHRDKMWIVGGDTNQGHYQSDIWNSEDGQAWTWVNRDHPVPWGPRSLHHTTVFQDKIWVLGGQTMPAFAPSPEVFYRDLWTSGDGKTWSEVKPQKSYWSPRGMIGGSVTFRGRLWILGGGTYDTPTTPTREYYNDVWSTDDGVIWKEDLAQAPWDPRQFHHVAVYDGRMWVLGGYQGGDLNDVWYSADGTNWYRQNRTPWQARHAASVFVHDQALWIAAGSCMTRDVWRLQRSTDPTYRAPLESVPRVRAVVLLQGLRQRKIFHFDEGNPQGNPTSFIRREGKPADLFIFSEEFGLNYLDREGNNTYAEMRLLPTGDIQFSRWRDGGKSSVVHVDNDARPRQIILQVN